MDTRGKECNKRREGEDRPSREKHVVRLLPISRTHSPSLSVLHHAHLPIPPSSWRDGQARCSMHHVCEHLGCGLSQELFTKAVAGKRLTHSRHRERYRHTKSLFPGLHGITTVQVKNRDSLAVAITHVQLSAHLSPLFHQRHQHHTPPSPSLLIRKCQPQP